MILSVFAAFITVPSAWDNLRFKIGNYDIEGETALVKNAIRQFSAHIAGFYDSGGAAAGLNTIPAANMVKRRIAMDIRDLIDKGKVLAIDRDKSSVKQILFADLTHAVAVVDEDWFSQYQDAQLRARKPLSAKKAGFITVRYFLKKMWSRWIIIDYEVYLRDDEMMPVPFEQFLQW